ncbi:hypothetical protein Tel_13045 [Candidatus Tenderia electrophaga]|jgi:lambda family phage tail tape measure protein|uniref:Bacteriophage tail tape measure C-terminal domain-containing protein n=1 Tax=Candidatus Tenderia electrophaga TaxID=1748243 RepID=A0A0S2TFT8_9GAMM|nr:hypothetical protein Tel_13045 [Candidatus Tenderia electrophaga]
MLDNQLRVQIVGDDRDLRATVQRSGRNLKQLGSTGNRANRELADGAEKVQRSYRLVAGAIGLVTAGIGGFSLAQLVENTVAVTRETEAWARAVGVSTKTLQAWNYAGEQAALQQGKIGDIFKDTAEKIADAYTTGGGEAADALAQLNLRAADLVGLSPDQQLLAIGNALSDLGTQGEKVKVMEDLASDASLLLPLLDDNAKHLRAFITEAEASGVALSALDSAAISELGKEFAQLRAQGTGFGNELTVALAPAIHGVNQALTDMIAGWDGMGNAATKSVEIAVTGLGFVLDVGRELQTLLKLSQVGWLQLGKAGVDALIGTGEAGIELINTVLQPIRDLLGNIWEIEGELVTLAGRVTGIDWMQQYGQFLQDFSASMKTSRLEMEDFTALQGRLQQSLAGANTELQALINSDAPSTELQDWLESNRAELEKIAAEAVEANAAMTGLGQRSGSANDAFYKRLSAAESTIQAARTETEKFTDEMLRLNAQFIAGDIGAQTYEVAIKQAFDGIEAEGTASLQALIDAVHGWGREFTDTLAKSVTTGKFNFKDLADSIIQDLLRIQIQQSITEPLLAAGGDIFGGLFSAGTKHTGGIVGSENSGSRMVSPALFAGAPRYHTGGIAGDEVPIIAKRGEGVFTQGQMRAMGGGNQNVRVVMENRGQPQQVSDTDVSFDAEGMVVRIVTDDMRRGGPISGTMSRTFNLRRGA